MAYEIKNAIIQRNASGESFELIDPEGYFKDENVLVAINSDTLITVQILIKAILRNDFKKWDEITDFSDKDYVAGLFVKLGYKKEEIAELLKDL